MKSTKPAAFLTILILSLSMSAMAGVVPDTGQSKCYNDTQEISCLTLSGKDFYGQDAVYTINPSSYTKLDAQGNDLTDNVTEWIMVRDNVTGLIWEVKQAKDEKADYSNIHDADNVYTWYDSNPETNGGDPGNLGIAGNTADVINALNFEAFGGYSDWRLPDREELRSITDYGRYMPATDPNYFPGTASSGYWSSVTLADEDDAGKSWCLHFEYGLESGRDKSSEYYVRAVRGGEERNSDRLMNYDHGTVKDIETGLIWQQRSEPAMTWKEALAYCETLTLGGPEDWRLPTIKELASLADLDRINPAINIKYFTDTSGTSAYWTSTTYAGDIASAWGMAFDLGNDNIHSKSGKYHVRAVRGGWVSVTGLILVAGGGIDDDNTLKESTKYLADLVCSRFLGRGFDEKDIYYFDPNGPNGLFYDFNGNGEKDLIVSDETPTVEELRSSIEIWAVDQASNPGPLYLVMINHGGIDTFEIYPGEIINASGLNEALTKFQDTTNRDVVVMIEACKSGSFVDDLSAPNRLIITCTDENDAYLEIKGRISFTQFFMDKLRAGETFADSFAYAQSQLKACGTPYSRMNPKIEEGTGSSLQLERLGGDYAVAGLFPKISDPPEYPDIKPDTSQTFSVTVSDISNDTKVWAVVRPPDYRPPALVEDLKAPEVTLPTLDLISENNDGVFTGSYEAFTCNGKYSIIFYARNEGVISLSSPTTVTVMPVIDYNGDNSTDIGDAILGLRMITGIGAEDTDVCRGEISGDGKIGLEEIVHILRTSAGL